MENSNKKAKYQLGVSIFVMLAFLTAAEYFIAVEFASTLLLAVVAIAVVASLSGCGLPQDVQDRLDQRQLRRHFGIPWVIRTVKPDPQKGEIIPVLCLTAADGMVQTN